MNAKEVKTIDTDIEIRQELDALRSSNGYTVEDAEERWLSRIVGSDYYDKILQLFKASKNWGDCEIDSYKTLLRIIGKLFQHDGVFEVFLETPHAHQRFIYKEEILYRFNQSRAYISALKLANYPKPIIVDPEAVRSDKVFKNMGATRSVNPDSTPILDLDDLPLSEKFKHEADAFAIRSNNGNLSGSYTTLMLLLSIYGEDKVLESLIKVNSEKYKADLDLLMKLLEDFDNLKEYPMHWIAALTLASN